MTDDATTAQLARIEAALERIIALLTGRCEP